VLRFVICDRGGCQHVLKGSSSTFQHSQHRRRGGSKAITPLVLKALQAPPLQALHLAYEAGPFASVL
jgi:hypothetical protein